MMKTLMRTAAAAALVFAMLAGTFAPASAETPEEFYKGKTLRIIIGHPPGGSYDVYARLAANHLKKYMPGVSNILVEGRPGGGGVIATQYLYSIAPKDGTVMAVFPEVIAGLQLMDPSIGKWDVSKMRYIGSMAPVTAVFIIGKSAKARTPKDMFTVKNSVGCTGIASQSYQTAALMKKLAKMDFDVTCGYKGGAELLLAVLRGEVDMASSAWNALTTEHQADLKSGDFTPVMQFGLVRLKELPNVPLMQEMVDDPKVKAAIEFASGGSDIGRALLAPPDVPADRIQYLRRAFDKMVKDPAFLAEAKKVSADIDPKTGEETQKIAEKILATPKDAVQMAADAMAGDKK
jgi:tripartite-type tricarboxylate transporter receptor subunit TctC